MMVCVGGEIEGRRVRGGTWGMYEQEDVRAEDPDTIVAFLEHKVTGVVVGGGKMRAEEWKGVIGGSGSRGT